MALGSYCDWIPSDGGILDPSIFGRFYVVTLKRVDDVCQNYLLEGMWHSLWTLKYNEHMA